MYEIEWVVNLGNMWQNDSPNSTIHHIHTHAHTKANTHARMYIRTCTHTPTNQIRSDRLCVCASHKCQNSVCFYRHRQLNLIETLRASVLYVCQLMLCGTCKTSPQFNIGKTTSNIIYNINAINTHNNNKKKEEKSKQKKKGILTWATETYTHRVWERVEESERTNVIEYVCACVKDNRNHRKLAIKKTQKFNWKICCQNFIDWKES